jgi:hypothetical protein
MSLHRRLFSAWIWATVIFTANISVSLAETKESYLIPFLQSYATVVKADKI